MDGQLLSVIFKITVLAKIGAINGHLKERISKIRENQALMPQKILQIKNNIGKVENGTMKGVNIKKMERQITRLEREARAPTKMGPTDRYRGIVKAGSQSHVIFMSPTGDVFQCPLVCHQGANTRHPNPDVERKGWRQTRNLIADQFLIGAEKDF